MEDRAAAPAVVAEKPPLGILAWIAGYKFTKAALALTAALVGMHLLHRNLAQTAARWTEFLGMDQQSRFVRRLVEHFSRLSPNRLHFFIGASLVYMARYIIEALGLLTEKRWAEWLVVAQSATLLPWEIYELGRHQDLARLTILLVNLAVIAYLLWRIRQENRSGFHGGQKTTDAA